MTIDLKPTAPPGGFDHGQRGMYCAPGGIPPNTGAVEVKDATLSLKRFVPDRAIPVASLAFCVTVPSSLNDLAVACIYSGDLTRVVGQTAEMAVLKQAARGVALPAVTPFWLFPGVVYYAGLRTQVGEGGTPAQVAGWDLGYGAAGCLFAPDADTATIGASEHITCKNTAAGTPLPTPATADGRSALAPAIAVREFTS